MGRGAGPLRHRQARPALRHGADRPHRGLRRHRGQGLLVAARSRRSSSPRAPSSPASSSTTSPSRPRRRAPPAWPGSVSWRTRTGTAAPSTGPWPATSRSRRQRRVLELTEAEPGDLILGRLGRVRHGLRGAGHAARGDRGPARGRGPASIRVGRRLPHVRRRRGRRPPAAGAPPVHHAVPRGPAAAGDRPLGRALPGLRPGAQRVGAGLGERPYPQPAAFRSRSSPRWASAPRRPNPASGSCWAPSATGRRRTPGSLSGSTGWWRSWPGRRTSGRSSPTRRPSPVPTC